MMVIINKANDSEPEWSDPIHLIEMACARVQVLIRIGPMPETKYDTLEVISELIGETLDQHRGDFGKGKGKGKDKGSGKSEKGDSGKGKDKGSGKQVFIIVCVCCYYYCHYYYYQGRWLRPAWRGLGQGLGQEPEGRLGQGLRRQRR